MLSLALFFSFKSSFPFPHKFFQSRFSGCKHKTPLYLYLKPDVFATAERLHSWGWGFRGGEFSLVQLF